MTVNWKWQIWHTILLHTKSFLVFKMCLCFSVIPFSTILMHRSFRGNVFVVVVYSLFVCFFLFKMFRSYFIFWNVKIKLFTINNTFFLFFSFVFETPWLAAKTLLHLSQSRTVNFFEWENHSTFRVTELLTLLDDYMILLGIKTFTL